MRGCCALTPAERTKLPGVVAVLTRDDLKGMNSHFGPVVKDQPVVAIDRVRYVGDIIAAVAAEEKDIAEEALELIKVDYEAAAGGLRSGCSNESERPDSTRRERKVRDPAGSR